MGTWFSNQHKTTTEFSFFVDASCTLNLIIHVWLRECKIESSSFPMDIRHLIVDTFIYRPIFDTKATNSISKKPKRDYDYLFKLIIVGDKQVGKTRLFDRFTDDDQMSALLTTIPVDFEIKNIDIMGKRIKLQIWDLKWAQTSLDTKAVFRYAHGALICYDITNKDSFYDGVRNWNDECDQKAEKMISKFLVGCKCDDEQNRQCQMEQTLDIAKECDIDQVIETSATKDINIDKVFNDIATKLVQWEMKREKCPFYG